MTNLEKSKKKFEKFSKIYFSKKLNEVTDHHTKSAGLILNLERLFSLVENNSVLTKYFHELEYRNFSNVNETRIYSRYNYAKYKVRYGEWQITFVNKDKFTDEEITEIFNLFLTNFAEIRDIMSLHLWSNTIVIRRKRS